MTFVIRPYQRQGVAAALAFLAAPSPRSGVVCRPMGLGKSVEIAYVLKYAVGRVLMITDSATLAEQNYAKLEPHIARETGKFSASLEEFDASRRFVVATIKTAVNRLDQLGEFEIIVVDECHEVPPSKTSMYQKLFDSQPQARIVGFTATPMRLKTGHIVRGRKPTFETVIDDTTDPQSVVKAIELGWLSNVVTISKDFVDTDSLKISKATGDFDEHEAAEAFTADKTAAIVAHTLKHAHDRQRVLAFCITKKHCQNVAAAFEDAGWKTAIVLGDTSTDLRKAIYERFRIGEIRIIVSVGCLLKGFDAPWIDCLLDIAPTTSQARHKQKGGRGMRPFEGKTNCLLLDCAGNLSRLGPLNGRVREVSGALTELAPMESVLCDSCGHTCKARLSACSSCAQARWSPRACPKCAAPLRGGISEVCECPPETIKCRGCRKEYPRTARQCPHCGTMRTELERPASEQAITADEPISLKGLRGKKFELAAMTIGARVEVVVGEEFRLVETEKGQWVKVTYKLSNDGKFFYVDKWISPKQGGWWTGWVKARVHGIGLEIGPVFEAIRAHSKAHPPYVKEIWILEKEGKKTDVLKEVMRTPKELREKS